MKLTNFPEGDLILDWRVYHPIENDSQISDPVVLQHLHLCELSLSTQKIGSKFSVLIQDLHARFPNTVFNRCAAAALCAGMITSRQTSRKPIEKRLRTYRSLAKNFDRVLPDLFRGLTNSRQFLEREILEGSYPILLKALNDRIVSLEKLLKSSQVQYRIDFYLALLDLAFEFQQYQKHELHSLLSMLFHGALGSKVEKLNSLGRRVNRASEKWRPRFSQGDFG